MIANTIRGLIRVIFSLQWVQTMMENRYVARVDNYSEISYNDICQYASKAAGIPESSIRMAMDSLYDAINYYVTEGHAIALPYLGTFTFGINGKATYNEEDAKRAAELVYRKKVRFLPCQELRQMLRNIQLLVSIEKRGNTESDRPEVTSWWTQNRASHNVSRVLLYSPWISFSGANLEGCTVTVTSYDAEGEETELDPIDMLRLSKNKYKIQLPEAGDAKGISHILVEKDGEEVFSQDFDITAGDPYVSTIVVNGQTLVAGITNTIPSADSYTIVLNGYQPGDAGLTINGSAPTYQAKGDTRATIVMALNDSNTFAVGGTTYTVAKSGSSSSAINSLTANGVTIGNGGSSTIIVGNTYNFVAAGTGLGELGQSDISAVGTVSNVVASDTQLSFTLVPSAAGTLSISGLFSCSLTVATSGITSVGGVANNGEYHMSASDDSASIVGTVPEGATVEVSGTGLTAAFNAQRTAITLSADGDYTGTLYIKNGTTTLFKMNVIWSGFM